MTACFPINCDPGSLAPNRAAGVLSAPAGRRDKGTLAPGKSFCNGSGAFCKGSVRAWPQTPATGQRRDQSRRRSGKNSGLPFVRVEADGGAGALPFNLVNLSPSD